MRNITATLAVLVLGGCAALTPQDKTTPCPQAGLIYNAASMTVFADGAAPVTENVVAHAKIDNYAGGCRMRDGYVEFGLDLNFAAVQGAQGQKLKSYRFPYFVAVLSENEDVLQRQSFSTTVPFDNKVAAPVDSTRTVEAAPTTRSGLTVENHTLRLPVQDGHVMTGQKVVIGFELTPAQLDFNRAGQTPPPKKK